MTLTTAIPLLLRYCGPLSRSQIEMWAEALGWQPTSACVVLRQLVRKGTVRHLRRASYRRTSLYGVAS